MTAQILNHLWESTLFAMLVWLLTLALRHYHAAIRQALWLIASLKFLIPFSLFTALGAWLAPATPRVEALSGWTSMLETVARPVPEAAAASPLMMTVVAIWGLGCAALIVRWCAQFYRVQTLIRLASPAGEAVDRQDRRIPVLITSDAVEPSLVGIIRPALLLPAQVRDRLSRNELTAVIAHELVHLRRRDNLTASLHRIVETLFWFHPLVWWIGARLIEERERACDEAVVAEGHDAATYAGSILNVCELGLARLMPEAAGISGGQLNRRIEGIMRSHAMIKLGNPAKLLLTGLAIAVLAVPVIGGALGSAAGSAFAQNDEEAVGDREFLPIVRVAPRYPVQAAEQRLEGWVIVEFTVTETGQVDDVVIVESTDPVFHQSAIDAASRFRYQPRMIDGEPVRVPGVRNMFTYALEEEDE
jgi:bla regulator protein blaR1